MSAAVGDAVHLDVRGVALGVATLLFLVGGSVGSAVVAGLGDLIGYRPAWPCSPYSRCSVWSPWCPRCGGRARCSPSFCSPPRRVAAAGQTGRMRILTGPDGPAAE